MAIRAMAQNEKPGAPGNAPAKAPHRAAGKGLFPTDSDTHILDRLNAIYKYRYVVVTVFFLVLLAVAVRTFTTTPMTQKTFAWDKFAANVKPRIPMRRWGNKEDFGGIAVYLISDASSYHSGDTFIIDGGYYTF